MKQPYTEGQILCGLPNTGVFQVGIIKAECESTAAVSWLGEEKRDNGQALGDKQSNFWESSVLRGCDRCVNQHDCSNHYRVCTIVIDDVLLFEYVQHFIAKYLVKICPYITENHFFTFKASCYLFSPLKCCHSFLSLKG